MDYEIQELFRNVGNYGITQEQVIELFTQYLDWKSKVNQVLKAMQDEQRKNFPSVATESIGLATQGNATA